MAALRRKRTFAIILALCFIAVIVLYRTSERITASVKTVRTSKHVDITRFDHSKETRASTTVPLQPAKTYFVVPIGVEEKIGEIITTNIANNAPTTVAKNDKEFAKNAPNTVAKSAPNTVAKSAPNTVAKNDKEVAKTVSTTVAKNDKVVATNDPTTVAKNDKEVAKNVPTTAAKNNKAVANVPLACKIPVLDPFHPVVSPLIHDVGTDLRKRCRSMYPRTPAFKVVNNKLVLRHGSKISANSIELKEIQRDGDFGFTYTAAKNPFLGAQSIRESKEIGDKDFFRLYYDIDGERVSDLYARIVPKVDILEKQMKIVEDLADQGIPLNVLIIGFDSTSRANFVRKMGGVISFLKTRMSTYFMEGMSIVGDATTPILAALLTGKYETKLPEGRRAFGGHPIDNWPWIMKEYEKHGYMTLFSEDDPGVSTFNLRLKGFQNSPVHHYMRPFWLSLEREDERDEPGLCSNAESMANLTLKYVNNFFDAYPKARKFAFAFLSYLTHAHPNHLSYAENDLLWLLRAFVKKGYHRDTMVVIMGDHGSRNSEFRDTMQGKLEERLPWFSVSLPFSFHRRYADLAANLRSNQPIISSPFDVHATLRHILTYPKIPRDGQTQSLFTKLPRTRTCDDAGIAEHWCPCFKSSPVNVASRQAQRIALATVDHINNELSKFTVLQTLCHRLSLNGIQDAVLLQANTKVQRFSSTDQDGDGSVRFGERTTDDLMRYQVIFTTKPNNAKYEATVYVSSDGRVKVNPEISRINRYNDQPKCIAKEYPHARKFCFCKT